MQIPQPLPDTLPQPGPAPEPPAPAPGPDVLPPEIIEPPLPDEHAPIGDPIRPVPVRTTFH